LDVDPRPYSDLRGFIRPPWALRIIRGKESTEWLNRF
jgi:hypothetical protein